MDRLRVDIDVAFAVLQSGAPKPSRPASHAEAGAACV